MRLSLSHDIGVGLSSRSSLSINSFMVNPRRKQKREERKTNGETPENRLLRIYVGGTSREKRMDSIFYRLSTRLSAPRMRPRSSLILVGGGCSSSLPSIARRRCVFCASRSSSRCAQMRNIRDETVSAEARYSSMSCTPAAKASSVGASPDVMRDN